MKAETKKGKRRFSSVSGNEKKDNKVKVCFLAASEM